MNGLGTEGLETGRIIAQIIGMLLALFLAVRALRSRRMDARRTGTMAAVWVAVIVGLTILLSVLHAR